MNKKGFTLIELLVSILLVSIVLVTMFATLVRLRKNYSDVYTNSSALIYSSAISKIINDDILDNNGIKYISCNSVGSVCSIILGNNSERKIRIIDNTNGESCVSMCKDNPSCKERCESKKPGNTDCLNTCIKRTLVSTIKYTDSTTTSEKLLYIKTLTLDIETDAVTKTKTSNGYNFFNMDYRQNKYDYDETLAGENYEYTGFLTDLTIHLYDGLNSFDTTYNIDLYSSSSIPKGSSLNGTMYQILFDTTNTAIIYTDMIYVKYGIGFYSADKEHKITKIDKPSSENGQKFLGYYYHDEEEDEDIEVIDMEGNIVAPNTLFTNAVTITPKFEDLIPEELTE